MKNTLYLKNAPWFKVTPLLKLFDIYEKAGFDIRLVGGCIRDSLLSRKAHDWDLTTNATPEESLEICQNSGLYVIPTGLKHGTITAIFNGIPFEITTLRIDKVTDGRHAEVIWTTHWAKDAARRDFTINALYGDRQGYIHDYFNGIADLKQGIVRFVGDAALRVKEDYLRILRYFRFMAYFGNFEQIHKESLQACLDHKEGLKKISAERIYNEIMRILLAPKRHEAVKLMEEINIFSILNLPIENNSLQILDDREKQLGFSKSFLRTLAFILKPKADWNKVALRLKLANKEKKHLTLLQQYMSLEPPLTKPILRYITYFHHLKIAQDIYILKKQPDNEKVNCWNKITPPPFPIVGKDLISLGIRSGKHMGKILKDLEEEYIKSDFSLNKEQLLKRIKL